MARKEIPKGYQTEKKEVLNPYAATGEPLPRTILASARDLKELQDARDELEEKVAALVQKIEFLRYAHIPQLMENDGVENIRLEGIGTLYLQSGIRASIPADQKPLAYQWLSDNGHGGLITETVNAQSLTSAMAARMRAGEEIPEGLFRIYAYTMAAIKK